MRLLVLGGTRFVGRAVVDEAIRRGYDVTTFTRGVSGEPRPGAQSLHGDRTNGADLAKLTTRDWDAVIDTSVLAPVHVSASARVLVGHVAHYTYVSSLRAYSEWPGAAVDEDSPTHECPPDAAGDLEYGPLKAGCERAVAEVFPGRCLLVRAGVIAGPHESPPRLSWWLERIAAGGRVLAPGAPDNPVRLVDVRDLAGWILDNTRRQIPGAVDVPGAAGHTFGELLAACENVTKAHRADSTGQETEFVWTPDETLLAAGVEPWWEMPMWTPSTPQWAGAWRVEGERARMTGIHYRPLADTVRDTWRWLRQEEMARGGPVAIGKETRALGGGHIIGQVGLDPTREREILASVS
ncbi:MAG: NAD-dependent epimerase/dehydratase family protein [Micromonosporaceae bacterium]